MNNVTAMTYIGPKQEDDPNYIAVMICFADDFDFDSLPKSVRARPTMTINFTGTDKNPKNEAGLKRLNRILEALEGKPVELEFGSENNLTQEEFFDLLDKD